MNNLLRTIGLIVVCLCVLAGVGLYFGWFTVSASNVDGTKPDVHVTLNRGKAQDDANAIKAGVKQSVEGTQEKAHNLLSETTVAGTIREMDAARQELTIRDDMNRDVTIKVNLMTRIKLGDRKGSFGDLKVLNPVSVVYETMKEGNVAKTITVSKDPDDLPS
jgi:hypothetical protein